MHPPTDQNIAFFHSISMETPGSATLWQRVGTLPAVRIRTSASARFRVCITWGNMLISSPITPREGQVGALSSVFSEKFSSFSFLFIGEVSWCWIKRGDLFTDINTKLSHGLLWSWIYGPKDQSLQDGVLEVISNQFASHEDSDIQLLIDATINWSDPCSMHPEDLVNRLLPLLQDKDELNESLRGYFIILHAISLRIPSLPKLRSDYGPGLLESMFMACQRQLCSGKKGLDEIILELCIRTVWWASCAPSHFHQLLVERSLWLCHGISIGISSQSQGLEKN